MPRLDTRSTPLCSSAPEPPTSLPAGIGSAEPGAGDQSQDVFKRAQGTARTEPEQCGQRPDAAPTPQTFSPVNPPVTCSRVVFIIIQRLRVTWARVMTCPRPGSTTAAQRSGRSRCCRGGSLPWCQVAVPGLEQAVKAIAEQAGGEQRQQPRTVL